jgi:hypothetical protein
MKYLSLLVLVVVLYASWRVVQRTGDLPETRHAEIQVELQTIIADYVKKALPGVTQITFKRFWTQSQGPEEVTASFVYSFLDEEKGPGKHPAEVEIEGTALLQRGSEPAGDAERPWLLTDIQISGNKLEYKTPLKVRPREEQEDLSETPAPEATDAPATDSDATGE